MQPLRFAPLNSVPLFARALTTCVLAACVLTACALGACILPSCAGATAERDQQARQEQSNRVERSFRFHYQASAQPQTPNGLVDLWIPIPINTTDQRISDLEVVCSHPHTIRPIQLSGNRAGNQQLDAGLALHAQSKGEAIQVNASFRVQRFEAKAHPVAAEAQLTSALQANSMVPLDGNVAQVASTLALQGSDRNKAEALYQHTLQRMNYNKPVGGSWGRGDAEWACDSRHGNCTDFHSYFIGLARSSGIPARFEMGFSVPNSELLTSEYSGEGTGGQVGGYHCWAWFVDNDNTEPQWVPVDISEADKQPELANYFFGNLDANRVTMTAGRDLLLDPAPKAGALNFFVYPYVEQNGVASLDGVAKKFWISE